MSTPLTHSPADVLRHALVNAGSALSPVVTLPSAGGAWPIFVDAEPDKPDSCITIYNTVGIINARSMIDGEMYEHQGIQVRVRDANSQEAYRETKVLANALDETILLDQVVIGYTTTSGGITTTGDATYTLYAVSRKGGILSLGKESPKSKRNLYTINAIMALTQTNLTAVVS